MTEADRRPGAKYDALDRRVAAALQVDGRATWTSIGQALGESERTVLRRGMRLIEDATVVVAARSAGALTTVVGIRCDPGLSRTIARAMAQRADSVIVHLVTGTPDCLAVMSSRTDELARLVLDDIPGIRGIASIFSQPVLRRVHTIAEWQPGELTDEEVAELRRHHHAKAHGKRLDPSVELPVDRADEFILRVLAQDGRTTVEEIARVAGVSDTTARRRIESLTRSGRLAIRAVVDPQVFGLPMEAALWLSVSPHLVDDVAEEIGRSPYARFVAVITGEEPVLAMVALPDLAALHALVTTSSWVGRVRRIRTSLVLSTGKRGGVVHVGSHRRN